MTGSAIHHRELGDLQAELHKTESRQTARTPEKAETGFSQDSAQAAPEPENGGELEQHLQELGGLLAESAGGAETFIAKHPLVSVLAAFTLGVALGRVIGKA
jgi:hypothetical protein